MTTFRWRPEMTTGLPDIDAQHRAMVARIEGLHDAMLRGEAAATVGPLLDELERATRVHFEAEERCMARYACPAGAANVAEHRRFLARFLEFRARLDREGPSAGLVVAIRIELGEWFAHHMRRTDAQLAKSVAAARDAV